MTSKVVPVIGIALVAGAAFLYLRQRRAAAAASGAPSGAFESVNSAIGSLTGAYGADINRGVGSLLGSAQDLAKTSLGITYGLYVKAPMAIAKGAVSTAQNLGSRALHGIESIF